MRRNGVSLYPEVFKKADLLKIVPDVILKELKKGTNINFETDTYKELRDVVTTIVHNHTNTTMPMDIEKRLLSVTEGGGAGGDDDERKEHNESQDNKIENEGEYLYDENGGSCASSEKVPEEDRRLKGKERVKPTKGPATTVEELGIWRKIAGSRRAKARAKATGRTEDGTARASSARAPTAKARA